MDRYYLSIIVIVILGFVLLKIILKRSIKWNNSSTSLIGKTVVVTGANTGIGFYTAMDFAKRGARVILVCRNKEKGEEAKKEIIAKANNRNVIVKIVDLSSLESIRNLAKDVNSTEKRIDILVNNAGVSGADIGRTNEGLNMLMQINYFGPFLLTILFLDLLKKSAPSRIVNVSSTMSHYANINPENLHAYPSSGSKFINYANTKFCNIIFTNELARRLKDSGVTANSLHPGSVNTEFYRNTPFILKIIMWGIIKVFYKTADEGAQTSIYVAVSKEIEGITGEHFANCGIARFPSMPRAARDEGLAKKIWEKTEEILKLPLNHQL